MLLESDVFRETNAGKNRRRTWRLEGRGQIAVLVDTVFTLAGRVIIGRENGWLRYDYAKRIYSEKHLIGQPSRAKSQILLRARRWQLYRKNALAQGLPW
jgi:hypothetical protein